jgi:hypothetical protein
MHFSLYHYPSDGLGKRKHGCLLGLLTGFMALNKSVNFSVFHLLICKMGLLGGLEENSIKLPSMCLAHSTIAL